MSQLNSLKPILEFGSTNIRLALYNDKIVNKNLFYEKKIRLNSNQSSNENHPVFDLIMKAEAEVGQHLNELTLVLDSSSVHSLEFSIQQKYEKKIVNQNDLDYLINESKQIIKSFNQEKDILHIIISNIFFDNKNVVNNDIKSQAVNKATIELKFILIDKKNFESIKKLLLKKHISITNIYCASYIKSLGLIKKLEIYGNSAFIDIGHNKSSLLIFENNKLKYLNNTHIGGNHITKDISKILKIDYRKAEAEKLKFSKKSKSELSSADSDLLKKIINSRLEEIIELLFFNCPLFQNKILQKDLNLYFIGNGSKVLNKNFLTFGPDFNFISEMSIIDELKKDCCDSALRFDINTEKIQPKKTDLVIENKGFFEKLFEYLSKK